MSILACIIIGVASAGVARIADDAEMELISKSQMSRQIYSHVSAGV